MSCENCQNNPQSAIPPDAILAKLQAGLNFETDDTILMPFINGYPTEPVDLQALVHAAETDTRLQLSVSQKSLIYTAERASNDVGTPDTIPIASISNLIMLTDLGDVTGTPNAGDLLVFNATSQAWEAYTVPTGTIVSSLGLDFAGNPVKQDSEESVDPVASTPIGSVIMWPGDVPSIPVGYFEVNGQELNRTVYAALFAIIGTTYGAGNGTTTFNIPNLSGRTPVGRLVDGGPFNALGQGSGERSHTLNTNEMPFHGHGVNDPGHAHSNTLGYYSEGSGGNNAGFEDHQSGFIGPVSWNSNPSGTGISIQGSGGSQAHNVIQPSLTLLFIIRAI